MGQLFANDWYRAHIAGKQECMIGYSDSGKDAGRIAAAWGLYEVQEKLIKVTHKIPECATRAPGFCRAWRCIPPRRDA